MLNTASALQLLLRCSEEPTLFTDSKVLFNFKPCDCVLALVRSRAAPHEFALFLFKRRRIIGSLKPVKAFPIVQELVISLQAPEFEVAWGECEETKVQGLCVDQTLLEAANRLKEEVASYQREAFSAKSNTHKWLWFYEAIVPVEVRDPNCTGAASFHHRESCELLPQHYGKQPMLVYIQQQLKKREERFTSLRSVSGFAGTWNCGGTSPSESLVPWLRSVSSPDFVCIGLQEICKLTASNLLGNEERAQQWTTFVLSEVQAAFGSNYIVLDTKALVGLLLITLIREELKPLICGKSIASSYVKLGCRGAIVGAM